jgi:Transglycosylase SLT domain
MESKGSDNKDDPGGGSHNETSGEVPNKGGVLSDLGVVPDGDRLVPFPVPQHVLCSTLASSAWENSLPLSFFSNLIWRESRFVIDAVSRAGALGIAQFMPRTANTELAAMACPAVAIIRSV